MGVEYIHDGVASGNLAARLLECDMDPNAMRPYRWRDGKTYIDKFVGNDDKGVPQYKPQRVANDSIVPWEVWRLIDQTVVETALPELRVIADLNAAPGVSRTVDAMSVGVLTHYKRSRSASSRVVWNPAVRARRDRAKYAPEHTPIPFIESEWAFELRDLRMAQRGGINLDLDQIRDATRSVLETAEDMVLGINQPFTHNGYSMPGILTFGDAETQVITDPTAGGWSPETTYNEVNLMRQKSIDNNFLGPWVLYFGYEWDLYLNKNFSALDPSGPTLRQKLLALDGISGVRILRRMTGKKVVLLQVNDRVIRLYNGMPLRAIQWESPDGFVVQGKIITSVAVEMRSDADGNTGLVVGATA